MLGFAENGLGNAELLALISAWKKRICIWPVFIANTQSTCGVQFAQIQNEAH